MKWICGWIGHEAGRQEFYNGGFRFARCHRCACDMLSAGAGWRPVPAGHRVRWKAGRHYHSIAPDYSRVLPAIRPDANLPSVRGRFASWSRALAEQRARQWQREAPVFEREWPVLAVVAALVGAGLELLFRGSVRKPLRAGP